jgi:hypothetical protein
MFLAKTPESPKNTKEQQSFSFVPFVEFRGFREDMLQGLGRTTISANRLGL